MAKKKLTMLSTVRVPTKHCDLGKFYDAMDALNVGAGFAYTLNGRLANQMAANVYTQARKTLKRFISRSLVRGETVSVIRIPTDLPLLDV